MADTGEGGGVKRGTDIAELRQQVLTFVARSLRGAAEKPIDEAVSRVLSKRRRKWRKRHNLPSEEGARPPDPGLRSEKEQLTEQYYKSGERLLACRSSGLALARQLERDKRTLQLQVAERYKKMVIQQPLDPRDSEQQIATREASEKDEIILKDLQRAISQADALVKVKKMKLSMTPRLPPLHRRAALDDTATTSEQFGMSLLVPAHQVLEQEATPTNHLSHATISAGERSRVLHQAMSPLLRSPGNGAAAEITSSQHHTTLANTSTATRIPANTTATAVKERMSLDPAVELAPIAKEVAAEEEEEGDSSAEELPRIACVMSLMEGQDTASVVEVTADNDDVIETNSSLKPDTVHPPEPSFDDRLTSNNVFPEKEEIVSTTPEDFHEEVEVESVPFALPRPVTLDANHNSMNPGATLDNHHRELNHHVGMAEAELVEMIMKDTELTAWIAKARLRPRTPISYKMTRKKRHSRSRSSSVHD